MDHKVFLDTNCIIDLIEQRIPNVEYVEKILKYKIYPVPSIAAPTVTNAYYITKYKNQQLYQIFINKFSIIALDEKLINQAFSLNMRDFEDAIQLASALKSNCNYFITWNKKDYIEAENYINILSPKEYCELINL